MTLDERFDVRSAVERMDNPSEQEFMCRTCGEYVPTRGLEIHNDWHTDMKYILHTLWNKVAVLPSRVPELLAKM